jgi:hypothetical protein
VRLCDFDDVSYRVLVDQTTTNLMKVGINIPCWRDIETKVRRAPLLAARHSACHVSTSLLTVDTCWRLVLPFRLSFNALSSPRILLFSVVDRVSFHYFVFVCGRLSCILIAYGRVDVVSIYFISFLRADAQSGGTDAMKKVRTVTAWRNQER